MHHQEHYQGHQAPQNTIHDAQVAAHTRSACAQRHICQALASMRDHARLPGHCADAAQACRQAVPGLTCTPAGAPSTCCRSASARRSAARPRTAPPPRPQSAPPVQMRQHISPPIHAARLFEQIAGPVTGQLKILALDCPSEHTLPAMQHTSSAGTTMRQSTMPKRGREHKDIARLLPVGLHAAPAEVRAQRLVVAAASARSSSGVRSVIRCSTASSWRPAPPAATPSRAASGSRSPAHACVPRGSAATSVCHTHLSNRLDDRLKRLHASSSKIAGDEANGLPQAPESAPSTSKEKAG